MKTFLIQSPCYGANGHHGSYYSIAFTDNEGNVIKGFGDHISEEDYGVKNVYEAEGTPFSDADRFISIKEIQINEKKFNAFVKKYRNNEKLSDKIISDREKKFGDSPYDYINSRKEGQEQREKEYKEWKEANPFPVDDYYGFLNLIK